MSLTDGTRIPNISIIPQDQRQHCTWCCDLGVVPVGTERRNIYRRKVVPNETGGREVKRVLDGEYDEEVWGPCPMCMKGFKMEFPEGEKWPWGGRGFWQGRPTRGIVKQCRCDAPASSPEQVKAGMAAVRQAMDKALTTPDPAVQRVTRDPVVQIVRDAVGAPARALVAAVAEPDHHRCVGQGGTDMPWPESECEFCGETL